MTTRKFLFVAAAFTAVLAMQNSAQALTITECSAKYKDAKAAGTLNGASWNDFRKSQCDLAPAKRPGGAPGSTSVQYLGGQPFVRVVSRCRFRRLPTDNLPAKGRV